MWNSTGPHHCPICEPVFNKRKQRIDIPLQLVNENYSGCGVDIGQCTKCQRYFQVSYKVDEITDITERIKK